MFLSHCGVTVAPDKTRQEKKFWPRSMEKTKKQDYRSPHSSALKEVKFKKKKSTTLAAVLFFTNSPVKAVRVCKLPLPYRVRVNS